MSHDLLVTGAGGFVGRHVCNALTVAGTDFIRSEADITDRDKVRAMIGDIRPKYCLHMAAIAAVGVAHAQPERAWTVNLHGTLNIAEAIRDLAPDCRMIFISSSDIYGASFRSSVPLDEQALLSPLNTYAATKASADLALGAMAATGLSLLRIRPFNHTGPGQAPDFVVPAFARQIASIEAGLSPPVIKVGSLSAERDFLDVRDVAQAYVSSIQTIETIPQNTLLNLASGMPRRIEDILSALLALSKVDIRIEVDPNRLRPSDIPRAVGNAARARTMLDWQPTIPWEKTLADVLDEWRKHIVSEQN